MSDVASEERGELAFAPARVRVVERPDGGRLVTCPTPLAPCEPAVTRWLARWASEAPDRPFLLERDARGALVTATYAEVHARVVAAARGLLALGAGPERPLVLLSGNSIWHAVLSLAAQHVGVPAVPVSVAYSLLSRDHAKLRRIVELVDPAAVFVEDAAPFAPALAAVDLRRATVIAARSIPDGSVPDGAVPDGAVSVDALLARAPGPEVEAAHAAVGPDTIAKILFTSGSTGEPKGVINTHRMLTSNQQQIAQCWPFLEDRPPVLVDWLPWNHTFGGNHNFFMVLRNGGTLLINQGKPVPALVEQTIENLRALPPTLYFDVPRGFDVLLPHLERDDALRERFFSRLGLVFYAGAALPQSLWDRMEAVSLRARSTPIPMVSAWGSTETSPLVTSVHFPIPRAGVIGLPAPGCEIKMVPNGGKLEMRVRGPNVTPGYWRQPALTAAAFDEEGFYKIGDAGRFEDPDAPEKGIVFDGRVTESFKLTTGTWVHVGTLRVEVVAACAPVVQDAVITGHDRDEVGMLVVPSLEGCRDVAGLGPDAPLEALVAHPEVRRRIAEGMASHARAGGSSQRVTRALVLLEPPSIDAGEITDKGYLNQRAMIERRAADVAALYAGEDPRVIEAAR